MSKIFYQKQNLGGALKEARKASGKTQADIALAIGVSIPTIRALERDQGTLRTFEQALRYLGLSLSGWWQRGEHQNIGRTITVLRTQRGLSQRALARESGVSHPTLFNLERTGECRIDILQSVFRALNHSLWIDEKSDQPGTPQGRVDVPSTRYLSLFSGIGGFDLAITQAQKKKNHGASCVGYAEIDRAAITIYERHFRHENFGDATKLRSEDLPHFELLVAGFPCQAFSIAGKRLGFDDTRGTLFFEIARIARSQQPRLLLLENVAGLLSHEEGATFRTILSVLDELGYDCEWQLLNSKDFGVAQHRERVFVVGHLRGTPAPQVFPLSCDGAEDAQRDTRAGGLIVPCSTQGNMPRPVIRVKEATRKGYAEATVGQAINLSVPNSQTRRGRVSDVAQTLDTGMQQYTLTADMRMRRLTPTECERLQGFPDGWTKGISDTQRYRCLGNAVTVPVVQAIVERLLDCVG